MSTTSKHLGVIYILFAVSLISFVFFQSVKTARAQQVDEVANLQCKGSWRGYFDACMSRKPSPGAAACTKEANGLNLATGCSGPACSGMCNFPKGGGAKADVCGGLKCGNQPEGASDQGAQQAMDMAKQLMDALQKQGGGGGGSGGGGSPDLGQQQQPPAEANFNGNPLFSGTSSSPLASFTQSVSDSVSGATNAAANFIQSVFGKGSVQEEKVKEAAGGQQGSEAAGKGVQPVVGAEGARAKGVSGNIVTTGGEGGIAASITDFFGRFFMGGNGNGDNSFFARICTARPWQATFVTRVFSANFFDSLCTQQGFGQNQNSNVFVPIQGGNAVGRASLNCPASVHIGTHASITWGCDGSQSAGYGFDTSGASSGTVSITPQDTAHYYLRCGNGGGTQCTIKVEKPRAQITAYPARVPLSARSEIFWTSENVTTCTIEGPGLKELGIRGAATTPAILSAVTYTMMCKDDDGRQTFDSITIDVGN